MSNLTHTSPDEFEVGEQVRRHPFLEFQGLSNGSWLVYFVIVIASSKLARIFPRLGLPLITGYMVCGCFCGPYVLNMVTKEEIPDLAYVTQVALSFIAFSAGSELYLPELRSLFKVILLITGLNALITYVFMTFFIYLLAIGGVIGWMSEYTGGCQFSIALIAASIMVARSPASAIAVVRELRAKGPVTSTMLGVTVVGDVVVLVLFTLSTSIALAQCSGGGFEGGAFLITILTLIVAVGMGYALGGLLIFLLWVPQVPAKYTIIPIGFLTFVLCDWFAVWSMEKLDVSLNFDALLICITAGYVVTNQSRNRVAFLNLLGSSATFIFIPFFTKVGVELNIPVFFQSLGFAVLVFLARVLCVGAGSFTGARLSGMDLKKQKTLWMTMLAQAGVSLGLASECRVKFPSFGGSLQTSIIAVVLINQFVGPVACKWALRHHDEAGKMLEGEDEHGHEALGPKKVKRGVIIGIDALSIAVAQRLLNNGWAVTLLDQNHEKLELKKKLIVLDPIIRKQAEAENQAKPEEPAIPSDVALLGDEESQKRSDDPEPSLSALSDSEQPEVSAYAAADAGGSSKAHFSTPGTATVDDEARLIVKELPFRASDSAVELGATLDRLIAPSSLSSIDAVLVQLSDDEFTYNAASHMLEARHCARVLARLYNPAWAPTFVEHGMVPFYGESTAAHMIYKGLTGKDPVFCADVESMPKAFNSFIETDEDFAFAMMGLAPSERRAFESQHPPPSVNALEKIKDITKLRLNTVTLSQRDQYMENLLRTHDHEYHYDDRETDAEQQMMLGPSGQASLQKKKKDGENAAAAALDEIEEEKRS